jgi:hypothetical protein
MIRSWQLLLVVAGCLVLSACGDGGKESAAGEIPFPDTQPFTEEESARLHEIRDNVARIRGLAVNEDVEEGIVKAEDLRAYMERAFAELDAKERSRPALL